MSSALLMIGVAAGAMGPGAEPLAAQDRDEDLIPIVPAGVPVVLLPVQSVQPTPGGAWPGGASSMEEALEALNAELAFAFGDRRAAREWVMPEEVATRAARNPVVRVDPSRLSYHGLLEPPKERQLLYEPLHGQVRKLAALFGSRLVLLPLAAWYEPRPPDEGTVAEEGDAEAGEPQLPEARGRAVLLMALIDVRRAVVLWHGTLEGGWAAPTSPALLATLAQRVARQLSPS